MEDLEESGDPDGCMAERLLELIDSYEEERYIPGDSFKLPGLTERTGMRLVEAKAERMPPYDERDEDVYGDADLQMRIIIHVDTANYTNYADDDQVKETMLNDVKKWIMSSFSEDRDNAHVLCVEVLNSAQDGDEVCHKDHCKVMLKLVCDGWMNSHVIGDVQDSPFLEDFWNFYMNDVITEGVCYVKNVVPDELKKKLADHIDEVATKTPVDFHPNSNDIVRDLVHPALYPYIKGVSKLKEGTKLPEKSNSDSSNFDFWGRKYEDSKFQWLPTPFQITADRKCQILDYINNLDRAQFPELYTDLEQLFEIFLPFFEEVWSYANAMNFFKSDDEDVDLKNIPKFKKESVCFTSKTLQVIPKIVEYKLQPGQSYEGVWHAEGMSHENIVMTGKIM